MGFVSPILSPERTQFYSSLRWPNETKQKSAKGSVQLSSGSAFAQAQVAALLNKFELHFTQKTNQQQGQQQWAANKWPNKSQAGRASNL